MDDSEIYGPINVLLIEDNPGDARLIEEMLKEAGGSQFSYNRADKLRTGIEQIDSNSYDVMLLDLGLPDSTGIDTFLKSQQHAPYLPIIVLTMHDDRSLAATAVREHAQDYLIKGQIDSALLTRSIRYAIERKRAEQELLETNDLLEKVFSSIHILLAYLDRDFSFLRVNRAYAEADGHLPVYYIGKNHFDLFPNEENRAIFQRVVDTGQPFFAFAKPFEYQEHPERGVSFWDWSLQPVLDPVGRVSSLVLSMIDVTEPRKAEIERLQLQEKYRSLFEDSIDTVFITAPDGTLLDINPAGVELFNYGSRREMIGLRMERDLYSDPSQMDMVLSQLRHKGFIKDQEVHMSTKDGEKLLVSITASMETDENGEPVSCRGIMRDITRNRQLEEQLLQAQKMESIGKLAGGVAHDFNNYLTAIQGYIDLALADLKDNDDIRASMKEVRRSAEHAANLTRQLLLLGRREQADMKPLNINKVIADLMKTLNRLIGERHNIITDLEDDLWITNADEGHIDQVLMNLVVNACDAMPEGGEIIIKTTNEYVDEKTAAPNAKARPGEFICLAVQDTGSGMEPSTLKHIFDPFFSTKGAGEGTGLGLSVVYGIIDDHNGWIEVESSPGSGTLFRIMLPAISRTLSDRDAIPMEAELKRGQGERILLVEDEEAVRNLASRILTSNGYEVADASTAEEALDLFEAEDGRFDLLFSDLILPGINGIRLADELRERRPKLPVVLASGYSFDVDRNQAEHHDYLFLRKPYSVADLLAHLKTLL